jgi:hypothetical protein
VGVVTPAADGSGNQWARTYFDGLGRTWRTERKGPALGQDIREDVTYDARGNQSQTTGRNTCQAPV